MSLSKSKDTHDVSEIDGAGKDEDKCVVPDFVLGLKEKYGNTIQSQ